MSGQNSGGNQIPRDDTTRNRTVPGAPAQHDRRNQVMNSTPHGLQQTTWLQSGSFNPVNQPPLMPIDHADALGGNGTPSIPFNYGPNTAMTTGRAEMPNMGFPTSNEHGLMEFGAVQTPSPAIPFEIDNSNTLYVYLCEWRGCSRSFGQKEERDRHVNDEHLTTLDRLPCEWGTCSFTYSRAEDLRKHVQTKHLSSTTYFDCTEDGCGKRYSTKDSFNKHLRSGHQKESS